jgi:hypothetical protein
MELKKASSSNRTWCTYDEEMYSGILGGLSTGKSGCLTSLFDFRSLRFACELKNFDALDFLIGKLVSSNGAQYALVASDEAINDGDEP